MLILVIEELALFTLKLLYSPQFYFYKFILCYTLACFPKGYFKYRLRNALWGMN